MAYDWLLLISAGGLGLAIWLVATFGESVLAEPGSIEYLGKGSEMLLLGILEVISANNETKALMSALTCGV